MPDEKVVCDGTKCDIKCGCTVAWCTVCGWNDDVGVGVELGE